MSNDNEPYFSDNEYTTSSFEYYTNLDELGRCGTEYACVGTDIMPTDIISSQNKPGNPKRLSGLFFTASSCINTLINIQDAI